MLGFEYNRADAEQAWKEYGIEISIEEGLAKGLAKGRAEGRAEGHATGLAEGRAEGLFTVAKNLITMNMPIEQIVQATGLSETEILKLKLS